METKNILLTIAVSIIMTIVIVALVNVGLSILQEEPRYEFYCNSTMYKVAPADEVANQKYNAEMNACNAQLDSAMKQYNQTRFYVFGIVGVILVMIGLFIASPIIRWTTLISGAILLIEGVVLNFANKITVFISLLIILILISIGVWRVIKKEFQ